MIIKKFFITNNEISSVTQGSCPKEKIVVEGDGLYLSSIDPGRLIYRGLNPNNRIYIKEDGVNNTLYRIISYEADGSVKIVRGESIGTIAWDAADRNNEQNSFCQYSNINYIGCNAWGNSSNTLYLGSSFSNSYYYYSTDNRGIVTIDSSLNTYLNSDWLANTSIDKYIEIHNFSTGGIYYGNSTVSTKGFVWENITEDYLTWTGKIGLMNVTEIVETSTNSNCTSVYSNYKNRSITYPCQYDNWIVKDYSQWSLTPNSTNHHHVWAFIFDGTNHYFSNVGVDESVDVLPTFYLKPTVVLTGTGEEGNEYTISN